jgi:hypothetical protein
VITVEHLKAQIKSAKEEHNRKIDEWLKEKVFPNFKQNMVVDVPSWTGLSDLMASLEERGFHVTHYSSYQGTVVYLSYEE